MAIKTFDKVFKNYYMIPNYQRGYAWQEKQLEDFWNDIESIKDEKLDNYHFFGSFYIEEYRYINQDFQLVIDGQQRLTTLVIFLFELVNSIDGQKKFADIQKHLVYQKVNQNKDFLENIIFQTDTNNDIDFENIYQKNLFFTKNYFKKKFLEKDNKDKLLIMRQVTEHLLFDVINIKKDLCKDINSNIVFETLNNRGKPLSILEKLKNRLMYLNSKISGGSKALEDRINNAWKNIYNLLGEVDEQYIDENNPLDDDLVSAHLTIYRRSENTTFSAKGASVKLFQMFCLTPEKYPLNESVDKENKKEPKLSRKKIDDYISSLESFNNAWVKILNFNKIDNPQLKKCLMLDHSKELKILLATIEILETTQYKNRIYELLEAVLFRQTLPNEWPRTRNFATLAYYFYHKDKEVEENIFMKRETLKEELEFALKEEFDGESVSQGFKNYYTSGKGNAGFYKWKGLKYFLYEYDKQIEKFTGDTLDYNQLEIEHIYPRNPDKWNISIPANKISKNVLIH